ncbi:MAG: SPFH domain-containing protein, partial [Oscillospiraceae bacterium]|nr:SPFH domain-containing protein [Oscillospiraceae bacterium]
NVCGNVEDEYPRSEIESQLKTEFVDALQPAFAKLSALELRPSAIPAHAQELSQAMNESLSQKWGQLRGLSVVSVAMNPITLTEEASEMIQQAQRNAMYRDPTMAAATLVGAQADAMRMAAANENGAMNGFIGMGLAGQAGGGNPESLFQMGNRPGSTPPSAPKASDDSWTCTCGTRNTGRFCTECGKERPTEQDSWTCSCGTKNTGKFCTECGKKKPEDGWRCACGAVNQGKVCTECGKKKPEGAPLYRCDQCGWEPEDPRNPPKFCPQCGDPFDDNDKQ